MRTSDSEDQPSSGCKSRWCCLGGHSCVKIHLSTNGNWEEWSQVQWVPPLSQSSSFTGPDWEMIMGREVCGDAWEKVKRSRGAAHNYCMDRVCVEGRYMSVLGAQVLRVGVKRGWVLEVMEKTEGLKLKRQADHKSGSSEGSAECFLSWCSCRSRSPPPAFAAPQEKMK